MNLFNKLHQPNRKALRPHQEKALSMIKNSLGKGNRSVVLCASCGFGKSLTAAKIIQGALAKGNKVIFICPQINLVDQTVAAFEEEGIYDIGVMQADHERTDQYAMVQVATIQTISRRGIPESSLIIWDECHVNSRKLEKFMVDNPDLFFIGLSATPWRKGMGLVWQDMVIPITLQELIDQGYLSEFRVFAPDDPDMSGVGTSRKGDFEDAGAVEVMNSITGNIVKTWLEKGENRPTLCFCVNRAHAASVQDQFLAAGVNAEYVDGETDTVERDIIKASFIRGDVPVICSVRTMTTGVDLPVSCLIDAAPTKSFMLHVQKIGRGLRVNPGTEDCIILDHAGNSLRLGLVTDIHFDELDKTRPGEKPKKGEKKEKLPKPCPKCDTLITTKICGHCGFEKTPQSGIDVEEGELVEIGPSAKKEKWTMAEKQKFWSMALWLADERRRPKLAKALYKQKFDVWPKGLNDNMVKPDQAFMNYEKSRRIAWAKSKNRGR